MEKPSLIDALDIVLELASDNALDVEVEEHLLEQAKYQQECIQMVFDYTNELEKELGIAPLFGSLPLEEN